MFFYFLKKSSNKNISNKDNIDLSGLNEEEDNDKTEYFLEGRL